MHKSIFCIHVHLKIPYSEERAMKLVVFDWNNTLFNDSSATWGGVQAIFSHYQKNPPTRHEYFTELQIDYLNIYQKRGIPAPREEINTVFEAHYNRHAAEAELTTGAKEVLQTLADKNFLIYLLTLQPERIAMPFLEKFGIDGYFRRMKFEAFDKGKHLKRFLKQADIPRPWCFMVGDAPSDVRHANNAGVVSVAYLNDFVPHELVLAEKPHHTITAMEDLLRLV